MSCQHREFEVFTRVGRLQENKGFKITGYCADIKIHCKECDMPFEFMGLPMGLITGGAAMSVDGLEARLSIQPSTQSEAYLTALKEAHITNNGEENGNKKPRVKR